MTSDLGCRLPVFTGKRVNAIVYQALLRWYGPLGPEDLSWREIRLTGIQRRPAQLKQPCGCCGIPIFGGLAAIFARLEFAGLLCVMHFAGESLGYGLTGRPRSVHRCRM